MTLALPTVIVPVFNAVRALDACLASLERTLPEASQVLIADDASSDPNVEALARGWCQRSRLAARYCRRTGNLGLLANCNAAFGETGDADVVLLDADSLATSGWLQQLARCAAGDVRIATITPWSNHGELSSFPQFCQDNRAPDFPDGIAEAAAGLAIADFPELPGTAGFCLFIRRQALRQVGDFDVGTFGRSRAGQNDFCRRAAAMGWRNVLCPNAYVVRNASASPEPQEPEGEKMQALLARWPDYQEAMARFILSDPLAPLRRQLAERIERLEHSGPQRDLFT